VTAQRPDLLVQAGSLGNTASARAAAARSRDGAAGGIQLLQTLAEQPTNIHGQDSPLSYAFVTGHAVCSNRRDAAS
jgi:hypothetical protein